MIRQTCSIGLRSGEYGGKETISTALLISEYVLSLSMSLLAFLCHGALSITRTIFLAVLENAAINWRILLIVVSKLNQSGFVIKSSPLSGMTKPLYATDCLPGNDLTFGQLPLGNHWRVIVAPTVK